MVPGSGCREGGPPVRAAAAEGREVEDVGVAVGARRGGIVVGGVRGGVWVLGWFGGWDDGCGFLLLWLMRAEEIDFGQNDF